MKSISLQYEEKNEKWYLYYNNTLKGKHYNLKEATQQILKEEERGMIK